MLARLLVASTSSNRLKKAALKRPMSSAKTASSLLLCARCVPSSLQLWPHSLVRNELRACRREHHCSILADRTEPEVLTTSRAKPSRIVRSACGSGGDGDWSKLSVTKAVEGSSRKRTSEGPSLASRYSVPSITSMSAIKSSSAASAASFVGIRVVERSRGLRSNVSSKPPIRHLINLLRIRRIQC